MYVCVYNSERDRQRSMEHGAQVIIRVGFVEK